MERQHMTIQSRTMGPVLIAEERQRQIDGEGFTPSHDDQHYQGELALAAVAYALPSYERCQKMANSNSVWGEVWPFAEGWWKPEPTDRVRELVKAGALIAAEIDRLLRIK